METKNTPLIFQQELNTFYKDILNCEITHPPYWAGRVPETFFLRRRKWIDAYQDWGGDEILDYINFGWQEYAIVKHDNYIRVKKWISEVDTSNISNIVNTNRLLHPGWWTFDEEWELWTFNITCQKLRSDGNKLYIFTVADYIVDWNTTKQLFVTEYTLNVKNNISTDYTFAWRTVRVTALSWLIDTSDIVCDFSPAGKSLFVYIWTTKKFYQVKLWRDFDLTTFSTEYTSSPIELEEGDTAKDMCISHWTDRILFVSWWEKIYCCSLHYNDITTLTEQPTSATFSDKVFVWLTITSDWMKAYATSGGTMYQYNFTTAYDLSTLSDSTYSKVISAEASWALTLSMSSDWLYFLINQNNTHIAQVWFEHAKTLAQQDYNSKVNHSFKRNFQSAKGNLLYWDGLTTKVTWSYWEQTGYILTPTPSLNLTLNELSGKYVMLCWWGTSADITKGIGWWQILRVRSNTVGPNSTITCADGWDVTPNETTYKIFDTYWEVLVFIGGDGLYSINDDVSTNWLIMQVPDNTKPNIQHIAWITKYENIISCIDADWNNWMIYAIQESWMILMSASQSNDWANQMGWWQFAGYFNQSSPLWSAIGAMRIVPFNDIVVVFSNTGIYVIKKETMDINGNSLYVYTMDLAFGFMGLHSPRAVCPYNTWIYFLSNKNTFLSLNIEESYYNKYKITTEDLGIDIQQWLDNIKDNDPVSIEINTETIFMTWYGWDKSTIFQYNNYYSFWHRWETKLMIKNLRVDTNETYLWAIAYRYWLEENKFDDWHLDYEQHLRWFHWESDVFSLKTILYHKLYLWVNTDLNSKVYYKARLSDGLYEYTIPLSNANFLQKASNLTAEKVLGKSILGYQVLGWNAEKYIIWTYLSDVDILEIPLWLTYALLEIIISWDFEIWGNILWALVHDPHLTPYDDVVAYLDE